MVLSYGVGDDSGGCKDWHCEWCWVMVAVVRVVLRYSGTLAIKGNSSSGVVSGKK